MKITKDAIKFFYRIFFSCYLSNKVYENNERVFQQKLNEDTDMEFEYFCEGLQEWNSRRQAILELAKSLKKAMIDKEVIARYFGGIEHTKIVTESLTEDKVPAGGKFWNYVIFNHMLIPLRITKVSSKCPEIVGVYENDGISIEIKKVVFYEKEREKVIVGKTVLCHYPMITDFEPSQEIIEILHGLQLNDHEFMLAARAIACGIDHAKYPFLSVLKKRMRK